MTLKKYRGGEGRREAGGGNRRKGGRERWLVYKISLKNDECKRILLVITLLIKELSSN